MSTISMGGPTAVLASRYRALASMRPGQDRAAFAVIQSAIGEPDQMRSWLYEFDAAARDLKAQVAGFDWNSRDAINRICGRVIEHAIWSAHHAWRKYFSLLDVQASVDALLILQDTTELAGIDFTISDVAVLRSRIGELLDLVAASDEFPPEIRQGILGGLSGIIAVIDGQGSTRSMWRRLSEVSMSLGRMTRDVTVAAGSVAVAVHSMLAAFGVTPPGPRLTDLAPDSAIVHVIHHGASGPSPQRELGPVPTPHELESGDGEQQGE